MINSINNKNDILGNLIKHQKENTEIKSKLSLSDLKRLTNNLSKDIFNDECSVWEGPILMANNKEYISFFINGKKISLNRILYKNYIGNLDDNEYLKYTCTNKGSCCSLKHIYKINKKVQKQNIPENLPEIIIPKKKSNIVSF